MMRLQNTLILALLLIGQESFSANAVNGAFRTEFACYSKIAKDSQILNKKLPKKFDFSAVAKNPEKLLSVGEPLGKGEVSKYYFFTEDGAFSYTVKQTEQNNGYFFRVHTDGKDQTIKLMRDQLETRYVSFAFLSDDLTDPTQINLPLEVTAQTRAKLIEALGQRIQSMKTTYDARTKFCDDRMQSFIKRGVKLEDRKCGIPIAKANEFVDELVACREALGFDPQYEHLKDLINEEITGFSTNSATPRVQKRKKIGTSDR